MPSAGNRSKKTAAKASQRKAVVAEKKRVERLATSLPARVAAAAPCPIHRCAHSKTLFALGLGYLVLARRLPSNVIANAVFLIDTFCLGVREVVYEESSPSEFDDLFEAMSGEEGLMELDPASARKLVRQAVAYAADFGLAPGKDYAVVEALFGDADSAQSTDHFVFGDDGKPLYVQGPTDRADRVREVTRALTARFGKDGWDMVSRADMDLFADDDDFMADDDTGSDAEVLDDVEYQRVETTSDSTRDT